MLLFFFQYNKTHFKNTSTDGTKFDNVDFRNSGEYKQVIIPIDILVLNSLYFQSLYPCYQDTVWIWHSFVVCLGLTHIETPPLPVKGCKLWPILGTYGHLYSALMVAAELYLPEIFFLTDRRGTVPPIVKTLMATEQWGFFSVPHLLWHGTSDPCIMTRGTRSIWTVTTRFNDLGLSRLGFEHPTLCMRGECSNHLHYRCSQTVSHFKLSGNFAKSW